MIMIIMMIVIALIAKLIALEADLAVGVSVS
jgi:hypothetical protein